MYYKNGTVFNSIQAIRNDMKDTSLPNIVTDSMIVELGYQIVVDVKPAYTETQYVVDGEVVEVDGVATKQYTVVDYTVEELQVIQATAMAQLVQHFTDVTTAYIEAKVQEYNKANGLAFANIDAFTKYAINTNSVHHTIANKFVAYADNVWTAVREYQATTTTVPSDEEFKAILDAVVF